MVYANPAAAVHHQFGSTPTNYGYGSWSAVYPPPNGTTATTHHQPTTPGGDHPPPPPLGFHQGTPPSTATAAIYSTSPPFPLFAHQGFQQAGQPSQVMTGLASQLQVTYYC